MDNVFEVQALEQSLRSCLLLLWPTPPAPPAVHLKLRHLQKQFVSSVECTTCHTLEQKLTGSALTPSCAIKLRYVPQNFPDVRRAEMEPSVKPSIHEYSHYQVSCISYLIFIIHSAWASYLKWPYPGLTSSFWNISKVNHKERHQVKYSVKEVCSIEGDFS